MLEDMYGQIECVLFPKTYERFKNNIKEEEILKISGTLKYEKGSDPKVLVDSIEMFEDYTEEQPLQPEPPKERDWLLIKLPDDKAEYIADILEIMDFYDGEITVVIEHKGKRSRVSKTVRRCNALESELQAFLEPDEYVFFRK